MSKIRVIEIESSEFETINPDNPIWSDSNLLETNSKFVRLKPPSWASDATIQSFKLRLEAAGKRVKVLPREPGPSVLSKPESIIHPAPKRQTIREVVKNIIDQGNSDRKLDLTEYCESLMDKWAV